MDTGQIGKSMTRGLLERYSIQPPIPGKFAHPQSKRPHLAQLLSSTQTLGDSVCRPSMCHQRTFLHYNGLQPVRPECQNENVAQSCDHDRRWIEARPAV